MPREMTGTAAGNTAPRASPRCTPLCYCNGPLLGVPWCLTLVRCAPEEGPGAPQKRDGFFRCNSTRFVGGCSVSAHTASVGDLPTLRKNSTFTRSAKKICGTLQTKTPASLTKARQPSFSKAVRRGSVEGCGVAGKNQSAPCLIQNVNASLEPKVLPTICFSIKDTAPEWEPKPEELPNGDS